MNELIKNWDNGQCLTVTYEGNGRDNVLFSSDINEGLDRNTTVSFIDKDREIIIEKPITQIGRRETFTNSDFVLVNGDTFNVLKPFTNVQYLQSSGTQYINLGIDFSDIDECYAEVAMLTDVTDKFFISPSKWNNNSNRFALGGIYSLSFGVGYGSISTGSTRFSPFISADTNKHIFTYKNHVFKMEDVGAKRDVTNITFGGNTAELRLFYGYNSPTECRIYRYWQKRNGELLIDLIPVVDSNEIPCMYDSVSNSLFYNNGSGEFIAG